jgi:ER-bound oxygenase mpaB/B'/Rubber oxygenase, catalytic domain
MQAAVERVHQVHDTVYGERHGARYSALDPELLLWVHATLVDSSIEAYARLVRPICLAVRERYYREMRRMGTAFGVPEALHPATYTDFRAYLTRTMSTLHIGDECQAVARLVLSPPAPLVLWPAGIASRFCLSGCSLPECGRSSACGGTAERSERSPRPRPSCVRRCRCFPTEFAGGRTLAKPSAGWDSFSGAPSASGLVGHPCADGGAERVDLEVPPHALGHVRIVAQPVVKLLARFELGHDRRSDHRPGVVEDRAAKENLTSIDERPDELEVLGPRAGATFGRIRVVAVPTDHDELH